MYVTYSEPPFDEEVDHVLLVVIAVRQRVCKIQRHNVIKSNSIDVSTQIQQQSGGV